MIPVREIDIAYLYEHAARELDVACAVTAILRQRGITTEILQWPTSFFSSMGKFRPKLVVLPFCYTERSFLRLLQYWSDAIFFNMTWEQLFYSGNQIAKTPRGEFSLRHVVHHSWSIDYSKFLRGQGIPDEYIFTNGHPAYMLYKEPYRAYFPTRKDLAAKYRLAPDKKWIFFPENYNWAFYTEATLERFIKDGQSAQDIEVMRRFCNSSLQEVLRWCEDAVLQGDIEVIIRPRPATHIDDFTTFSKKVIAEFSPNLHIIQGEGIREWILAADVVVSSHSTSLIEAAIAQKPAFMLEPYPIPSALHVDWHNFVPRISSRERFLQVCFRPEHSPVDHRLADWGEKTLISNGDSIINLAGRLEQLVVGEVVRPPVMDMRKQLTLAKRIIPKWLWAKYHQSRGWGVAIPEEYKKDIVTPEEMEARIRRWQLIKLNPLRQGNW